MAEIDFVAHPPERSAPRGPSLLCAGCCCCCCCLHTVGGVIGGIAAGRDQVLTTADPLAASGDPPASGAGLLGQSTVTGLYWKVLGVLCIIVLIVGVGVYGIGAILMALPLMQLIASAVVAVVIRKQPAPAWRQLARLTGFSLLGAIVGVGIMLGFFYSK